MYQLLACGKSVLGGDFVDVVDPVGFGLRRRFDGRLLVAGEVGEAVG